MNVSRQTYFLALGSLLGFSLTLILGFCSGQEILTNLWNAILGAWMGCLFIKLLLLVICVHRQPENCAEKNSEASKENKE